MKKKRNKRQHHDEYVVMKFLLTMKLIILFLFLGVMQISASVYSQNTRISLELNNCTVKEALHKIEEQSEFHFFYNERFIDLNRRVSIKSEGKEIRQILDEIFSGLNLSYKITENNLILITPKDKTFFDETLQIITVTGKVTDASGTPIPGVTITVKGTSQGTITDMDGNYSIDVNSGSAILVFSFIGYLSEEVAINDQHVVDVTLVEDIMELDEVVVIGYGTVKKSDITGSVSSIKAEDLTIYPAGDALQAMQGMAAGVQISSTNGEPGSEYSISIRGNTSINASSEPLVVVDGFPGATMPPPDDIESMEILKDASSTAIYGSRGANGVIMITTKSGKAGQFKVDFNSSLSFQKEINRLEVLNLTEYIDYINEIDPGYYGDPSEYNGGTDWQDAIYRDGMLQNYQLSVTGGTDKVTYYLSGNYYDQKGIVEGSQYNRYSLTSNITAQVFDWLNVGSKVFARHIDRDGVRSQPGGYYDPGVTDMAYKCPPTVWPKINQDGTFPTVDRGLEADNPYAIAVGYQNDNITNLTEGNIYAELNLLRGLKFKSTFGVNSLSGREGQYYPTTTYEGSSSNGKAELGYVKTMDIANENYFTYSTTFNDMHLNVMAGYSYEHFTGEGMSVEDLTDFPNDNFSYWNLSAGAGTPYISSYQTETELSSFYGRLNYSISSKYLFTFNARYDGSSKFAKHKKRAFFPSGAFAWNIKNESFMESVELISQLKLRASYGVTGNQAIDPYQSLTTLTNVFVTRGNQIITGMREGTIANPYLTWESTKQTDIGIDLGLWDGRMTLTTDYYNKLTSDLLFEVDVPMYTGHDMQVQNIGKMENKGFEFAIGVKILTGALKWNTNANISFNRNKVLTLVENDSEGNAQIYGTAPVEGGSGIDTQILKEGESVGSFFGYVYDGVLQDGETPLVNGESGGGAPKYKDLSGPDGIPDGTLDSYDRTIIGNPHPDFIWGWNNILSYRNFDLNIFIQGSQGGDIINFTRMELGVLNGRTNASKEALDRWTPTHTDTDIPRANDSRAQVFSDRWVEDASYIRVKNISLGYNFNKNLLNKIKVRSARVYVSAQNILTITNYKGVDPEVAYSSSNRNLGLDYGSYPNTKSITVGINLGF